MERSRGFRLRRVRQGAGFRQQRVALAPPHPAPLEPEYSASARHGRADAQAAERVHLVHQGGQGHPLTARAANQLLRSADAARPRADLSGDKLTGWRIRQPWSTGPMPAPSGKPPSIAPVTYSLAASTAVGTSAPSASHDAIAEASVHPVPCV